jgi:release factor glutamine methyltransferase
MRPRYGDAVGSADIVARLRAAGCVFAEDEADILLQTTTDPVRLDELVSQRCDGMPLEHVVGWTRFAGLRLAVHPGVFVPRLRSEALVREAVAVTPEGATVLDLCCGCGALAAAIAAAVPGIALWASDIDPAAVRNAAENLAPFTAVVRVGDLDEAMPEQLRGAVHVVVANVPYVPSSRVEYLPAEAREHERRVALDGGEDGLDVLRRMAPRMVRWLRPGGRFLTECALDQASTAAGVLQHAGMEPLVHNDDELEVAVVSGRRYIEI